MDIMNNKIVPIIYMIGVLMLVLPGFLNKNSKIKIFFQNFSIWFAIILVLFSIMYFIRFI